MAKVASPAFDAKPRRASSVRGATVSLALLAAPAALAVDLDRLSADQKKLYCVLYVDFDAQVQVDQNRMTSGEYRNLQLEMGNKIFGRNGNPTMGFSSRFDTAAETIMAEDISFDELADLARVCRAFLRL